MFQSKCVYMHTMKSLNGSQDTQWTHNPHTQDSEAVLYSNVTPIPSYMYIHNCSYMYIHCISLYIYFIWKPTCIYTIYLYISDSCTNLDSGLTWTVKNACKAGMHTFACHVVYKQVFFLAKYEAFGGRWWSHTYTPAPVTTGLGQSSKRHPTPTTHWVESHVSICCSGTSYKGHSE